jgi:hypothetical protein
MLRARQGFVFGWEKEVERRENRKGKEFLIYRKRIKLEFRPF